MVIGDQNIFETGPKIEARSIGNLNIFNAKCVVMNDVTVGSGCIITPKVQVINRRKLADGSIVFGDNLVHRQSSVHR
eukprot:UN03307